MRYRILIDNIELISVFIVILIMLDFLFYPRLYSMNRIIGCGSLNLLHMSIAAFVKNLNCSLFPINFNIFAKSAYQFQQIKFSRKTTAKMLMQTVFCSFVHGMEVIANNSIENPNVNSNDENANGNDNLLVSQEIEKGHILVQNYHYNDELLFNELLVLYSMYARNFSRRYMNNFLMDLDELEKYTTQYGINCCKQKLKVAELGRRAVELYEEIQKHDPSMLEGIKVPHYNSVISSKKFGFYKFEIEQLPKFEKMLQEFRERYKYLIESFQLYDDKLNLLQSHIDKCTELESLKDVVHVIPISLEE